MKQDKAPGLDGLTLDVWKLENTQKYLNLFYIQTFNGFCPDEWGLSGIVPVPKKVDLTRCTNYHGIPNCFKSMQSADFHILEVIHPPQETLIPASAKRGDL